MSITIRRLHDALGAEVLGLDPSNGIDAEVSAELHGAFLEHHLLVLRCEPLPPQGFVALARHFGTPKVQLIRDQRVDGVAEVSALESTYRRAKDKPSDLALKRLSSWHTDDSYFATPAKATMLQALEVPSAGGETKFCNTRAIYEGLAPDLRTRLDPLQAVHSYDTIRAPANAQTRSTDESNDTPDVIHPLIRTHDDTGARALYLNPNRTDRIVGMERTESDALLDELHAQMHNPAHQYHHQWCVGDVLLWDNRCLVHSVNMDFPVGEPRRHQRILLEGGIPL